MTPSLSLTLKCHKIKFSAFILIHSSMFQSFIFSLLSIQLIGCGYEMIQSREIKAQYLRFENRTPFPSLSITLKKAWSSHNHECSASSAILSLSNPLSFSTEITVEQSVLNLKLFLPNGQKYEDQELITYSISRMLTEEQVLNQSTYRLAKRIYLQCTSSLKK